MKEYKDTIWIALNQIRIFQNLIQKFGPANENTKKNIKNMKLNTLILFAAAANITNKLINSDLVTNTRKRESISPQNHIDNLIMKFLSSILLSFVVLTGFLSVYFIKNTISRISNV